MITWGRGFSCVSLRDSETPIWIPSHHLNRIMRELPRKRHFAWDGEPSVTSLKSLSLKQTKITIPLPSTHQNKIPTWGQIRRLTLKSKEILENEGIARTWKQPRCPSADEWIRKLWYIYTMEYYSAIKNNSFESVLMRWMKLEPIIQSEVSQKDKEHYSILTHIYGI